MPRLQLSKALTGEVLAALPSEAAEAMTSRAVAKLVPGWAPTTVRHALNELVRRGQVVKVRPTPMDVAMRFWRPAF